MREARDDQTGNQLRLADQPRSHSCRHLDADGRRRRLHLRRDVTDQIRINSAQAARLEALTERMNARDVADATLSARFGAVEELMRDMRNELRDMRGPLPASNPRRAR